MKTRFTKSLFFFLATSLIGFGCGSKSNSKFESAEEPIETSFTPLPVVTPNSSPTPSPSSSPTALNPPYSFILRLNAANGFTARTPRITDADSILRVTIRPASEVTNTLPGYSAYNYNAGCFDYQVIFAGEMRKTPVLQLPENTHLCPQAPTHAITDFSERLGGQNVRIKVKKPRYDFLCQWWLGTGFLTHPDAGPFLCPLKSVHENHEVSVHVCVQTNGTRPCNE